MFKQDKDHLDQHFLIDEEIITRYIESINIKKSDTIVEIGAGKGVLTKIMAPLCKKLIVIELDKTLKPYLDKIENIEVIYNNVLDTSIPKCNKIVTSLPYSIIEPFMQKLITTDFEELIMLMGSTYINHVLNKDITRLSIITNSYFIYLTYTVSILINTRFTSIKSTSIITISFRRSTKHIYCVI